MTALPARQVLHVCTASGSVGFLLGAARHPLWQDAVEPAQVLAGIVRYVPHTPVYDYSMGVWTIWHQVLAALLHLGASEQTLSVVMSGVLGMVSLQALAMCVFASSGDRWLSIASSFLIYWSDATRPAVLMGVMTTYGVIGASWSLLVMALLGAGQARAGAVMLGVSVAVHPVWGVFTIAATLWAGATTGAGSPTRSRVFRAWFAAGLAVSAASAMLHAGAGGFRGGPGAELASAEFATFVRLWDDHRIVVNLVSYRAAPVVLASGLALWWLWTRRTMGPACGGILLRALVASSVAGTVLSLVYYAPEWVPAPLLAMMPSRLLDLGALACTALVVGLAATGQSDVRTHALVTGLLVVLLLEPALAAWDGAPINTLIQLAGAVCVVWCASTAARASQATVARAHRLRWARAAVLASAGVMCLTVGGQSLRAFPFTHARVFSADSTLAAARGRPGLLLTAGGMHLAQLRTRRPVLLDGGALDGLPYVPGVLPEAVRILERVYGVDFQRPPGVLEAEHRGALDAETGRELWEDRTIEAWQMIGREFSVTDVLTPAEWQLRLAVVARSADFVLWTIPWR